MTSDLDRFLADVDSHLEQLGEAGRPISLRTLSLYLFSNSYRIETIKDGGDVGARRLAAAHEALLRRMKNAEPMEL